MYLLSSNDCFINMSLQTNKIRKKLAYIYSGILTEFLDFVVERDMYASAQLRELLRRFLLIQVVHSIIYLIYSISCRMTMFNSDFQIWLLISPIYFIGSFFYCLQVNGRIECKKGNYLFYVMIGIRRLSKSYTFSIQRYLGVAEYFSISAQKLYDQNVYEKR